MLGKVKTFNKQKGFGFINCQEEEGDIFFHYSSLVMEGYKTIEVEKITNMRLSYYNGFPVKWQRFFCHFLLS